MIIETRNLKLISCNVDMLTSAIEGNEMFATKIGATVHDNWTEFGISALQYVLDKLTEHPDESNWWTYFPIHKQENALIGSGGYMGKPSTDGMIEIGYEIAPAYRNRGFATEMAMGLIANGFKDANVKTIIAHTLGCDNASTRVLQKCGFSKVQEFNDPDEGVIWKWELKRM